DQDHSDQERRILRRSRDSLWTVHEHRSVRFHVQIHNVLCRKVETVRILSDKQYIDKILDDLAECQSYDRKVVSLQTKDRNADNDTEDRCNSHSDEQRQDKSERRDSDHISHAL